MTLDKPARFIVNSAAGTNSDLVVRLYAERLRDVYAPQVIVDNRTGAAGRIGLEALKASAPDGATMAITHDSSLTIYPHIYQRTLRYDLARDFVIVAPLGAFSFSIAVSPRSEFRNFRQFAEWAHGRQGVAFASSAAGSAPHFVAMEMCKAIDLQASHVPYRDNGQIIGDLQAQRLGFAMQLVGSHAELHRSGQLRSLAVSAEARSPLMPDVPTFAELGLPQLTAEEWYVLLVPAGTPTPLVSGLRAAVTAAAEDAALAEALSRVGLHVVKASPEQLADRLRTQTARWGEVVRETGFSVEEAR
ncbi:tripartite tricarboxylate transporter substrate-binding protein [Roseomonas sp. NAR14]|uniref:Tripartite tricarboxylate transporter substrate-binding protein n=2 Tax=Roseomonas acroporae TaxID=2937791 RepID=A0A9X1YBG5_9PROT|nr:tripartite tricarboxylate transporter substrate-binding protein [Roseomonas acroporae]